MNHKDDSEAKLLAKALCGDWQALAQRNIPWEQLVQRAMRERVGPLLFVAADIADEHLNVPPAAQNALMLCYRQTQAANLMLCHVLANVLDLLAQQGVAVIVLKGAALLHLVYKDIGLRPMGDIDLLVRPEQAEQALAALLAAGFRRVGKPELRPGFAREFQVEIELLSPGPYPVQVEIHWNLLGPLFVSRHIHLDALWERAERVELEGQPAWVLGPEDWLLHLAAHAFYKHRHVSLSNLCDIRYLLVSLSDRLKWGTLLKIADENRWLPALKYILGSVVGLSGVSVPPEIFSAAETSAGSAFEKYWMEWWLKPGRAERLHVIPDWFLLPDWSARGRMLRAYLAPSREYMRACYPHCQEWQLPFCYLQRLFTEMLSV